MAIIFAKKLQFYLTVVASLKEKADLAKLHYFSKIWTCTKLHISDFTMNKKWQGLFSLLLVNNIKINEHFFLRRCIIRLYVCNNKNFRLAHYFSNENPKHHHLTSCTLKHFSSVFLRILSYDTQPWWQAIMRKNQQNCCESSSSF